MLVNTGPGSNILVNTGPGSNMLVNTGPDDILDIYGLAYANCLVQINSFHPNNNGVNATGLCIRGK